MYRIFGATLAYFTQIFIELKQVDVFNKSTTNSFLIKSGLEFLAIILVCVSLKLGKCSVIRFLSIIIVIISNFTASILGNF